MEIQTVNSQTGTVHTLTGSLPSPRDVRPAPAFQPMPAQFTWHNEIIPNVAYDVIVDGQQLRGFFDSTRGLFYVGTRRRARLFTLSAISAYRRAA